MDAITETSESSEPSAQKPTPCGVPPLISFQKSSEPPTSDIKLFKAEFKPFTSIGFNNLPPPNKLNIVHIIDQCGNFKQTFVPEFPNDTPIGRIWNNRKISIDLIDDKKRKPHDNIAIGNIKPENSVNDPIGMERDFITSNPHPDLIEKTNKMLTGVVDERKEKIRLRLLKKLKNRSKLKPTNI